MEGFNRASKRAATRAAHTLLLTTMQNARFAVAPTRNDYGDTFLGRWHADKGRYVCIAGVAPNGRVDPLGDLLIDGKPSIPDSDWDAIGSPWGSEATR